MEKEQKQELEWIEAQKVGISVDLVAVAKRQLRFLAEVDRNRSLYEGPVLLRAIYRYNACWLPLLAKHSKTPVCEGPLVVPLDCEWIWHCHRLNPVQYKSDCEEYYGMILDNSNVVSSIEEACQTETESIWQTLYPEEPYILDLTRALSEDISGKASLLEKCTKYDLVSGVKRQNPFFYQVSRPHMNNDQFLKGALARYKGFLHLIRTNRKKSLKRFCVPTYDIDLIWHSHQLHPVAYCHDLTELIGKVLEHDDTDSDRTKGMKLDVGFSGTTGQWEETFGRRYWRAGAMYRGSTPTPVTNTPFSSKVLSKKIITSNEYQSLIQLPEAKSVEVVLEFVEVSNLPEGHKGSLFVSFSKTQSDIFFDATRKLTILSESKVKQVASFQCEATGELLFELTSHSTSNLPLTKAPKILGTASLSLQDLLIPVSDLSVEKWLDLVPCSGNASSKPIRLRVSASITIPVPAERVLQMVHSRQSLKNSCFFPFPGKMKDAKSRTHVIDEAGNKLISLQIRNPEKAKAKENNLSKKVVGITSSGETFTLAEFVGTGWSLMNSYWSLHSCKNSSGDDHIFELVGNKLVKFYPGKKLEYETRHCQKHRNEKDFITAVEFSTEHPYGKAVALINLKSGFLKVKEEWVLLPSFISFMIFSDTVKEHYDTFAVTPKNLEETKTVSENIDSTNKDVNGINTISSEASEIEFHANVTTKGELTSGGCGGCGAGCGSMVKSGGCGGCGGCGAGGCGSGCGSMVKSGGCGSCGGGCGGGCGSMVKSGGCGGCGAGCSGGCGGGCGNMVKSGGCGGCGATGCGGCGGGIGSMVNNGGGAAELKGYGNVIKSGGCGGCGGGCGGARVAQADSNKTPTTLHANEAVAA